MSGEDTLLTGLFPNSAARCGAADHATEAAENTDAAKNTGEAEIAGVKLTELAEQYGTPLYLLDVAELKSTAERTVAALTGEFARVGASAKVYYASKALLNQSVARWVTETGMHLDVASGGELEVALAAGVDPALIGVHGNNKSREELAAAVTAGVGSIVVDSAEEVRILQETCSEIGGRATVILRVNSGVHAATHGYLATSHEDQKFGVPKSQAAELVAAINAASQLDFRGIHCHIGSQIFDTAGFKESADRMVEIASELAQLAPVSELNLGGGFGIAYTPEELPQVPDIAALAAELADIVAAACEKRGLKIPAVAFEPGRSIVGKAGVTLYRVGVTKTVELTGSDSEADPADLGYKTRRYISVDGGMSDNARPALYGADYTAVLANRVSDAPLTLSRVVGKHCESGDIVINRQLLPADITEGDLLAVAATGAYCWSLASNYNYLPRPAIVALEDGSHRVIVRPVTVSDLVMLSQ